MAVSLSIVGDLLTQLLRIHQRVSLPGIGAFISEYQCATIIKNGKGMLPPTRKVTFHAGEPWNDGLLEEAVAAKEMIPLDEAKKQLSQFIAEVNVLLTEGKRVEFPEFGTLRITGDGRYAFDKDMEVNLLTDSFGLLELDLTPLSYDPPAIPPKPEVVPPPKVPPVEVNPVKNNTEKTIAIPKTDNMKKPEPAKPLVTPLTPIAPPEKKKRKCAVACWILLALLLLTLAAFLFRSMYLFYNSQPEETESTWQQAPTPEAPEPEDVQDIEEETFTPPVRPEPVAHQPAAAQPDPRPAVTKVPVDKAGSKRMNRYHIMLGSYTGEAAAQSAKLQQEATGGCNCLVLHTGGSRPYKVSAFHYTTQSEADEILRSLKRTDAEYANAWVEKF
jgi:nucleoid DNA-binding protein